MASLKTERKVKAKKTHGNNPATFLYLSHTFPRTCWTKCSKPPYLVAKPLVSCNNLPLNPTNHNISYLYMGIISIYIYRERGNIHINWYIYIYIIIIIIVMMIIIIIFILYLYIMYIISAPMHPLPWFHPIPRRCSSVVPKSKPRTKTRQRLDCLGLTARHGDPVWRQRF